MTLTYFTARSNFVKIAHCASNQWSGEHLQDCWFSGFSRSGRDFVNYE